MEATTTPQPLRFARHIVGMAILALASPYVWHDSQPFMTWTMTWLVPIGMALVVFGLYALFFTKRAKAAWPGRFFMLAWVLVALGVASPYLTTFNQKLASQAEPPKLQQTQPSGSAKYLTDEEVGLTPAKR